jgi:rsbT co-antagonist protein RsbR
MNDNNYQAPINDLSIDEYKALYKVNNDDISTIRKFGKFITADMAQYTEKFYIWLQEQPEFEQFFQDEKLLKQVIGQQDRYWINLFEAKLDESYLQDRRIVGEVHARIGLPLSVYFAAMNTMLELFATAIEEHKMRADERSRTYRALTKLIQMDTSIVVETYTQLTGETITRQSRSLVSMSTPVTEIWEGVLLLPIVGVVDSQRAQDIMDAILTKVAETSSKVAIMDIAGVAVVDTAVANHLIKITKATKLMGCNCTISGVSPAIAQTIVELGIDVGEVQTTATLRDALGSAFNVIGVSLLAKK